jgi:hypothetical protein
MIEQHITLFFKYNWASKVYSFREPEQEVSRKTVISATLLEKGPSIQPH